MTAKNNIIHLEKRHAGYSSNSCQDCLSRPLCFSNELDIDELPKLDGYIKHLRPTQRRQFICRAGDALDGLYIVRSGSFKSYRLYNDGSLHITGFHFAGEIMGMSDIRTGIRSDYIESLETSSICALSLAAMEQLMAASPKLMMQVLARVSSEVEREKDNNYLLRKLSVDQKMANFLLTLANRSYRSGFSKNTLRISMTRSDIANYLGMAVETVSRVLHRFSEQDLLTTACRDIEIIDHSGLVTVAA